MKTKFTDFNFSKDDFDEDNIEYNKIRKIIKSFIKKETYNDSFSQFMKDDYYYDKIDTLEQELVNSGNISLNEFMNKYRKRIYEDNKFTQCCGMLDIILYRYDKKHPLGGDITVDAVNRYQYGYQNYSLGRLYLEQKFGTLENFYNEIVNDIIKKYLLVDSYTEIVNDVEGCTLIFTHSDNLNNNFHQNFDEGKYIILDNIAIIFVGDENSIKSLIDEFTRRFDIDKINDWLDFEEIKKDVDFHQTVKKYNVGI